MEKFMDPLATLMKNLGNPEGTTELKTNNHRRRYARGRKPLCGAIAQQEGEMLLGLLSLHAGLGHM